MKALVCLVVLTAYCHVGLGEPAYSKGVDESVHRRLLNLLKQLKELQSERLANEEDRDQRSKNKEKSKDNGQKNIDAINEKNVDPKSKDLKLFASMLVVEHGKKTKPYDLPEDENPFVKGLEEDEHKLTHEQKVEQGLESERLSETGKRGLNKRAFTSRGLWEKGIIPYVVDESLNTVSYLAVINSAVETYNNLTCVQWLPHSESVQNLVGHQSYVKFYSGSGCWSYVSRAFNGEQLLSLKSPGCVHVGIALHEMLHAAGASHEQSRTDRDQHVYISETIQENGNYNKAKSRDYNPYDYESVMQYGFKDGFEALQPELSFLSKFGSGFTFYDIADITDAYRCTDACVNPPECKNGGFLNHRCKCYCPYGLTGPTCDEVINANVCGGILDLASGDEVTITSPHFPQNYDVDRVCVWLIRGPPSKHVKIEIDVLHLPFNTEDNRCYHWLEIRYNLVGQTGIRICGDSSGDSWVTSPWGEKNLMTLIFDTEFGRLHSPELGFSLRATAVNDGCIPNPCVYGVCKDCDNQDYKCECDPGFEGQHCNQVTAESTLRCTFEDGSTCFLRNADNDNFDWIMYSGPTPSDYTGPDDSYGGKFYMYAESSAPRVEGDKAVLESDITFPAEDRCLTFYYNMQGEGVGSLEVLTGSDVIWTKSGNQGYGWRWAQVNVPASANLQIKIEATRGTDWEGDIGIDEIQLSSGVCESAHERDCYTESVGKDYRGTLSYTTSGLPCQRWDSDTPHSHSYHDYDGEENYCRNIRGNRKAPWCYTTSPDKRREYCDVPHCEVENCARSKNGYDYTGDKDVTIQGEKCIENTKCRATGTTAKPWCYTNNPLVRWDACDVPKCTTPPKECKHTKRGMEYFGSISVTASGKTCQRWDAQSPFDHKFWFLDDQENYCRNPDDSSGPWCYPDDPNATEKEYCTIPYCEDVGCTSNPCLFGATCENTENGGHVCLCAVGFTGSDCGTKILNQDAGDCRRSEIGYEYQGHINYTVSGRTCQKWALDTPHSHSYNDLPENYCRNPDKKAAPWCYTTDSSQRWELCDVPLCTSPARECLETELGVEYFGTVRHTENGFQCQRWADQTPHSHSRGYISEQEDYCRNPYGAYPRPWCYTLDPNKRKDYCAIPSC